MHIPGRSLFPILSDRAPVSLSGPVAPKSSGDRRSPIRPHRLGGSASNVEDRRNRQGPHLVFVAVEDIDRLCSTVAASRPPTKVRALEDKSWGLREFHILDPDGCLLRFGEDLEVG